MTLDNAHAVDELESEVEALSQRLRDVMRCAAGDPVVELADRVLAAARRRRQGDPQATAELQSLVAGLNGDQLHALIAAFSIFFDVVNLAEDRHRVRVLRSRQLRSGDVVRRESVGMAIEQLAQAGLDRQAVERLIDRLDLELVFTAHPTEAKRRSVRDQIAELRQHLTALDRPDLLPIERRRREQSVQANLFTLWQTDLLRTRRPSVLEEVDRALSFTPTLWSVLPSLYEDLQDAMDRHFPGSCLPIRAPIRFGSWIGGDRDGHPGVTHALTEQAMCRMRAVAIDLHLGECRALRQSLSLSSKRSPADPKLNEALGDYLKRFPALRPLIEKVSSAEVHRQFLHIIEWRLCQCQPQLEAGQSAGAYQCAAELLTDVRVLLNAVSVVPGGDWIAAAVRRWICRIHAFGLHGMRMDIRQESSWYESVLDELLAAAGWTPHYAELSEAEKQDVLVRTLSASHEWRGVSMTPPTQETWDLFQLIATWAAAGRGESFGAQVVSMTHQPSDVLEVLWLAEQAARSLGLPANEFAMPIAPLMETIEDLQAADQILEQLMGIQAYRDHVRRCGGQWLMVGYSDSTKDGSYLAATWHVYRCQWRVHETLDRLGIPLTVFHGRGGALGRGGGPAARGILSLPPKTFRGSMRMTEQGEVLSERYDDEAIAFRHLEQVCWAALAVAADSGAGTQREWEETIEQLADDSQQAYRQLLVMPGFMDFFEQATPISIIEQLPIGSRPARRHSERTLESLRAIPWVFSWTQNRCLLPAWYGLGTAVERLSQRNDAASGILRRMYERWPFFAATIGNAELALAKADLGICHRYRALMDEPFAEDIWSRLREEFERSRRAVLHITQQGELLATIPWLKRSIERRNPFVDPLNFIQVELMRRLRVGAVATEDRAQWSQLARLTVQAISGGLRTSG